MILFLILNLLKYCLLIIPEKIEITSLSNDNKPVENCPCDLTYNTCDRNCECDEKCNTIDHGTDNYDIYNEYKKPGNHIFEKKYQKLLPMCSDLDKSPITDLYSPLTIGYQILKKGLCLFNKDAVKYDDDLNYDDSIDEIIEKLDLDNDIDDSDSLNNEQSKNFSDINTSFDIYDNLNITFPIMLPDGSCLKNNSYIKFLQDKKVICNDNINKDEIENLEENFDNVNVYSISEDNTYLDDSSEGDIIKKISFEFYVNSDKNIIDESNLTLIYKKKKKNDSKYIEESGVIYEVKFYSNNIGKKKIKTFSGNPGYIKGNPLLTKFIANRVFSGVNLNGKCVEKNTNKKIIYEDDIIENTFTFEDNIIYGCYLNGNADNKNLVIYENIINEHDNYYFQLGNSRKEKKKISYSYSQINDNLNILSLDVLYEAIGAKYNRQNQLLYIKNYGDKTLVDNKKSRYIKVNAFKVKSETKWWYAPGWKITFPKNIMYPFRIGTTSYEAK